MLPKYIKKSTPAASLFCQKNRNFSKLYNFFLHKHGMSAYKTYLPQYLYHYENLILNDFKKNVNLNHIWMRKKWKQRFSWDICFNLVFDDISIIFLWTFLKIYYFHARTKLHAVSLRAAEIIYLGTSTRGKWMARWCLPDFVDVTRQSDVMEKDKCDVAVQADFFIQILCFCIVTQDHCETIERFYTLVCDWITC